MGEDETFPVLQDLARGVGFVAAIHAVVLAFTWATAIVFSTTAYALCLLVPIPL